jgi:hypothetical protein
MFLYSVFDLAKKISELAKKQIRDYLVENRAHFLFELAHRELFIDNKQYGAESIKAFDVTVVPASQIRLQNGKSVAQHFADKGKPLKHPGFGCIIVKRSPTHYDYIPLEAVFYASA